MPRTSLVIVNRSGSPEHTPEAEGLVVETDGERAVLRLDDGEEIECDRGELIAALESKAA
jgi:hypothetical protein